MKAIKDGVALRRQELSALLLAASREATNRNAYGVEFQVKGDVVFARATNDVLGLQAKGNNDGFEEGEWFVHRDFLVAAHKLCTGKRAVVLEFSGASLNTAAITENGQRIEELVWEGEGAAIAQWNLPLVQKDLKTPSKRRTPAHYYAVSSEHVAQVDKIAKAAGVSHALFYPPDAPDKALSFTVDDEGETQWTGIIRPTPAKAKEDEEDPHEEAAE